jgi:choline dehydrogenase-like flavoprotein
MERYLEDMWREAPARAAAALTAAAILVAAWVRLSVFSVFRADSESRRTDPARRLLDSRFYPVRLLAYALRGHALVAALRDPAARQALLPARLHPAPKPPPSGAPAPPSLEPPAGADYVVIGSGAAGAVAAQVLARAGKDVVVLEEGAWRRAPDFKEELYEAMRTMFRDMGFQAATGRAVVPVMQGRCVGGSTVINGAITHRLPRAIYEEWARDAGLAREIPFEELEDDAEIIEQELGIKANLAPLLDGLPAAASLRRLGWRFEAMSRNAPGCQGTGRCLQGCPSGGKLSMEASYIPDAVRRGARVVPNARARRMILEGGRATAVEIEWRGERRAVRAGRAVVLAAGAVHSPLLLRSSGLQNPHIGRHFLCHLGAGTIGVLDRDAAGVEGPPQGIEILEFAGQGVKLATQLLPPELLLARSPVSGEELLSLLRGAARISSWTASVRSDAEGTVAPGLLGGARIRFEPSRHDLERLRFGVCRLAELLLEIGAQKVYPGLFGGPAAVAARADVEALGRAPLDSRHFHLGVGHIFGTCRLSSSPGTGAVDPSFRPHGTRGLYVVDASLFPSPPGVNPMLAIMQMARLASRRLAERPS